MDTDINRIESPSDGADGDGEGVWSPDIEECFREALQLFPPCGRRKHILQDEGGGKMYGRNELIARHIKMKTGKLRTRKQVSSHIQVLARRKAKSDVHQGGHSSNGVSPSPSSIGSGGQPQSASSLRQDEQIHQQLHLQLHPNPPHTIQYQPHHHHHNHHSHQQQQQKQQQQQAIAAVAAAAMCHPVASVTAGSFYPAAVNQTSATTTATTTTPTDLWLDRPIVTSKIRLVEFSAYLEHNYIQIDYRHPSFARHYLSAHQQRQMLESIDIKQIQDKFPGFLTTPGSGSGLGYMDRGSADAFYLVKFWADLGATSNFSTTDPSSMFEDQCQFNFSSQFETIEQYKSLTCSIKACSYGFQVVEKVEKLFGTYNQANGRYVYSLNRSPMCEFMIQFVRKLRQLPMLNQMNSVLENFTVVQVIESDTTSNNNLLMPNGHHNNNNNHHHQHHHSKPEVLLCLAYVFEVASTEQQAALNGPSYHVYKLTKD